MKFDLSRREVLVRSGLAAAGLAVGVKATGWLVGSDQAQAAVNAADWSDLPGSIRGNLMLPNSPQYPIAHLG
ncbi:MAG: twin-arginine translocation signal domain-containing protein, partial [Actinomycetales bacterium]